MTSPTHIISIEELSWGIALIGVTMTIHAFAMPMTMAACSLAQQRRPNWKGFFAGVRVLLLASCLIVTAHLVEVAVWAGFFLVRGAFPTASECFYYALLQYTTVGSELILPDRWHLLGGMIAMAGALAFAWSTAVLLALAQTFQDEQLQRMSISVPADGH